MTSTIPPLLYVALGLLVLAQLIGLIGLRKKLNLTASLGMFILLAAAATCGVLGGLQILPGRI